MVMNPFDSDNYPEQEPTEFRVGDFTAWKRPDLLAEFGPSSGFNLAYNWTKQDASGKMISTLGPGGPDLIIEYTDTITSQFIPGDWRWILSAVRQSDSAVAEIQIGQATVKPAHIDGSDTRSWAKRTLDAIEATIEGTASVEQSSMAIAGRSLSVRSFEELREMRDYFLSLVKDEEAKESGKASGNKILMRYPV